MMAFGWACVLIGACSAATGSRNAGDPGAMTALLDQPGGADNHAGRMAGAPESGRIAMLFHQAVGHMEEGREDRAIHDLQRVIDLAPGLSAPHNNLGILYKRGGKVDEAIREYRKAIDLNSDYAEAYNNLGIAYREKGVFDRAERAYQDSIRIKPDLTAAHFNLAVLYELYLGRPEDAIRHYRKYLDLGGDNRQEVQLWISGLEQELQRGRPAR